MTIITTVYPPKFNCPSADKVHPPATRQVETIIQYWTPSGAEDKKGLSDLELTVFRSLRLPIRHPLREKKSIFGPKRPEALCATRGGVLLALTRIKQRLESNRKGAGEAFVARFRKVAVIDKVGRRIVLL